MEQPGGGLRAELPPHSVKYGLEVADEVGPIMALMAMKRILAMVADIKQDNVVLRAQELPKGQIRIYGKAIAVAQCNPRTIGIAVASQPNDRAIDHFQVDDGVRFGNRQYRCFVEQMWGLAWDAPASVAPL